MMAEHGMSHIRIEPGDECELNLLDERLKVLLVSMVLACDQGGQEATLELLPWLIARTITATGNISSTHTLEARVIDRIAGLCRKWREEVDDDAGDDAMAAGEYWTEMDAGQIPPPVAGEPFALWLKERFDTDPERTAEVLPAALAGHLLTDRSPAEARSLLLDLFGAAKNIMDALESTMPGTRIH